MSETATPTLEEQLAALQAQVAAYKAAAAKGPSFGSKLRKFGRSVLAAFTTPEAVKAEKYLAVVALTRAALFVPGAAVLIDLLVKALGGPSVTP